ncbi:type II CRISPR RNA-guided endonuclease Cas9 [Sulfitobacter sp. M57]|uniref:type II CRISPR RNA-guided endonuclease Cas9 n=1 Tax=unclassified Sulfitobacter TaxID=196795 RepID=UPI002A2C8799|nr:type II CRISPR RNA-guided endonuclease Cas9 [Sulfitobacter sp. KE5]MDF3421641.1 type II CRISPR RNA-guided endonuclease Cas9 [Sulfitobacter sp. KE43]MDF3431625.1 type II CRISPR RNA-guided endonuclease Cas9 [Sulfitobacter sp. KE42]MDF3457266.1 type II CRISPR RNA-guided endonuclease Cas9 [Sulfitobacter sp. S74]MDF3461168.1 type II CRISPR RNA-guided endonuclease Cas9 [Sulfitobacter sp. Ks18]MDF3465068.1 type II CRISPR RNA-guided endonuclease Cas9 [Sulfitobacter sp. M05]MDF3468964.1 type II CRI
MRLGLDIGTNSIGWWLYATKEGSISSVVDGGVRVFSDGRDPKSGASLAVDRREARSQRRRRDRFLRRKAALMKRMAAVGLMPADPAEAKALELLDPYALRAEGLEQELPLTHFGRALFHLNQRRGFKSNRKTDRGDNESGKIKDATARLDQAMMAKGARTYGEFLHMFRSAATDAKQIPSVRTRLTVARRDHAEKEEAGYDYYPDRRHLSEEFGKLWASQSQYAPDILTNELRDEIRLIIFHQRPLKTPEVGLCLFTDERRIPSAHPLNQRRILMETVNGLRIAALGEPKRSLTLEERDQIVHALDNKAHTKSLAGMAMKLKALGKVIKLRSDQSFTLETANRDGIACDPVRASLSHPDRFGSRWSALDIVGQWDVIERIRAVQSDSEFQALVSYFMADHGLDRVHAEGAVNTPLPEGYGRLGLSATKRILAALEADVISYSAAVAACGWHHSDGRTGAVFENLPYYGEILDRHVIPGTYDPKDDDVTRYGRITNPTVHIGLNQLRRLVNRIVTAYGKPDEIVVELARDLKMSEDQKREVQRVIKKNTDAAKARGVKLVEELGVKDTGANRMIMRLWEDLSHDVMHRKCPYTGQQISAGMLFDGSCDVDHILPFSRTLDDGFANKTLCLKEANRQKTNKTPWEVWGDTDQWNVIAANLKNLPANKTWRFAPDAMERFEGENEFSARALKDTQYLSRIARSYLDALYDGGDGKNHVWVVPGRLTEMLRRHWGLNGLTALTDSEAQTVKAKNRTDHRHHAIDAAVIAATDRSLIQRISKIAGQDELDGAEQVARSVPPPWEGFRRDIGAQIAKIIVSHRADHGRIDPVARQSGKDSTSGQLHNDTAYGIKGGNTVVSRKPLMSLKPNDIAISTRGANIRDVDLQRHLQRITIGLEGKLFEAALSDFASAERLPDGSNNPYFGLRRVRLAETLQETARVEIKDKNGKHFKAYKGDSNYCYEIWRLPDGKIKAQVVTTFEAHQAGDEKKPHPAAKRLLRVFKRDMVRFERDGKTLLGYVQKLDLGNGLCIAPHTEANADARNRDRADPFRFIQMSAGPLIKANARRVYVDEMGRLRDPGAPKIAT